MIIKLKDMDTNNLDSQEIGNIIVLPKIRTVS